MVLLDGGTPWNLLATALTARAGSWCPRGSGFINFGVLGLTLRVNGGSLIAVLISLSFFLKEVAALSQRRGRASIGRDVVFGSTEVNIITNKSSLCI